MLPMREQALIDDKILDMVDRSTEKVLDIACKAAKKAVFRFPPTVIPEEKPIIKTEPVVLQPEPVKLWQVLSGKATQVLIHGEIFAIKDKCPENVDPVSVARLFTEVFDFKKTEIVRSIQPKEKPKVIAAPAKPTISKEKKGRKSSCNEPDEPFTHVNNIALHKRHVISLYNEFTDVFIARDVMDYFVKYYKSTGSKVSESTCRNKQRAYIQYLIDENCVVKYNTFGMTHQYKFIREPFTAEFDPVFMQSMKSKELAALREG